MKKWFKRLFCCHIWKDENKVFLKQKIKADVFLGVLMFNTYDYYAVSQRCLKCEHHRIVKEKKVS